MGAPDAGAYEFQGAASQCSGTDASCGAYPNCQNCNSLDGCTGDSYRDYSCSGTSCAYIDDNCSDCSCSCGGYNATESTANNNCSDAKDNDCDGSMDSADTGCQATECVDNTALANYIGQWKTGNITMPVLMQKIAAWKAGTGCSG